MKYQKGQGLVGLILWIALILVIIYVIWPWLNLVIIPWMIARFYGVLAGDMYSWAWLVLIVLILALVGRRYY